MAAERTAIQMAAQEALTAMLPGAMENAMATIKASMDTMMMGMQGIAGRLEKTEGAISQVSVQMDKVTNQWQEQLDDVKGELASVGAEARGNANDLNIQKQALLTKLDQEFGNYKKALDAIVIQARDEFDGVKTSLHGLHEQTSQAFRQVKEKVEEMESSGGGQGNGGGRIRGYIPAKTLIPKAYEGAEEKWRSWQDDVMDYLDAMQPGMRELLKAVEAKEGVVDDEWLAGATLTYNSAAVGDGEHLWRALKTLTDGEARKVVMSTKAGDGFNAWKSCICALAPAWRRSRASC